LLSIDHQKELARYDVYFERCFTTPATNKISWEQVYDNVRQVGPSTTILATDLGQTTNPHVVEGLSKFVSHFLDAGFTDSEVRQMVRTNPGNLLGALEGATAAAR
jgi:hypothetical protein